MNASPRWISKKALLLLHEEAIAAFVDGNKRAAFLAIGLFLVINGQELVAEPAALLGALLR